MKAMPGDRVRVRTKHAYGEGEGRWGIVAERQSKRLTLVIFDADTRKQKRTLVHDADVVEVAVNMRARPCSRCHGLRRVYTSEGTADCPCSYDDGEHRDPISGAPIPHVHICPTCKE